MLAWVAGSSPLAALLPARARQAFARILEVMIPGADLEPDSRFIIPMHNLSDAKTMKQFLSLLSTALEAARTMHG